MAEQTQNEEREGRFRRGGIVGPMILIGIGVVLLLNNLGMLPWGIWGTVWRAWPVILILVGLDILIGRRSVWGTIVVLLVTAAVLAGIVAVSSWPQFGQGRIVRENFVRASEEASRAEIRLEPGVANLDVSGSSDASALVEAHISHPQDWPVAPDYRLSDGTAHFDLAGSRSRRTWMPFGPTAAGEWDVKLGPAVPVSLWIDNGVGNADIDLRSIPTSRLDLNAGVGRTKIRLPNEGPIDVSVDGGIGATTIVIPSTVAARIESDSGIGSLNVPGSYRKDGDVYTSGSRDATNTADIDVKIGIGSVTVEEAP